MTLEEAFQQGVQALNEGRPRDACAVLEPLARQAANPQVDILLSHALAGSGRLEESLDALRSATRRRPPFPPAFLELGVGLTDLGRLEEALAVYEDGLRLTDDQNVRLGLGYLHMQRGDAPAAQAAFGGVLDASPERPDAMVGSAKAHALAGDHAAAVELYRSALGLRPGLDAIRVDLAKSLLELNRRDEAQVLLREASAAAKSPAPGPVLAALADASHGRMFLRPSAAAAFLKT